MEPNPVAGVFAEGTALVDRIFAIMVPCVALLHRVALGIGVAQGECLVPRLIRRAEHVLLMFVYFVACGPLDHLKDAARVISGRDVRRARRREAAEKSGRRRRSHNDEAEERDAPIHGPPQMLPGAARDGLASPEQLPACGGLPVDRTCLLEGGLYVAQLLRPYTRTP